MALTLQDIQQVAHLARIQINAQESAATLQKLSGIMDLISEMQAVDTAGIEPMSHSQDVTQRLREDVVTKTNQRELFQQNVPRLGNIGSGNDANEQAVADGLYLVPKVIE